jgi:hypothetical protein
VSNPLAPSRHGVFWIRCFDDSHILFFGCVGRFTNNHRPFIIFLYDDICRTYFDDILFCCSFGRCSYILPCQIDRPLRPSTPAILLGLCLVIGLSGAQSVLYGGANLLNTEFGVPPKRGTVASQMDTVACPTFDLGHMVEINMCMEMT